MDISSIGSNPFQKLSPACCSNSETEQARGSGRRGRGMMHRMKEMQEAQKEGEGGNNSSDEFDELDVNKDGVVDEDELKAAGLSTEPEFQSSQAFLSLLAESNKAVIEEHEV